ncbi:hypothetical protein [Sphingomonas bacterium]|uniref:hypothetical protein n=1 Tax=Sphingomonas bacterium TaxID=1895847 RepID=UPI0015777157|nr:hypothetical protein [Sphingomonas bacterium]
MKRANKDWNAKLERSAARGGVRYRNRRVVIPLMVLTLTLAGGGLMADIWLRSHWLSITTYVSAGISGCTLFAYLLDKRLRIKPPPHR